MATVNLIPGGGYIVNRGTGTNLIPGGGYVKETAAPATTTNGPIVTIIGAT